MQLNWDIEDSTITFDYMGTRIFFEMPETVTALPSERALHLAEWLMLSPWHDIPTEPNPEPMDKTDDISTDGCILAFSGGVDSTAAYQVMPHVLPVYVERHGIDKPTLLNQSAHLKLCEEIGAIRIRTNFEIMRTNHDKMVGYSTGRGMAVPLILLAEAADRPGIAYGAVFDDNTFAKGFFRARTPAYYARQKRFTDAGMRCVEPLFGCSEVITTRIVDDGPYKDLARSCLRGTVDKPCGRCYKCTRKKLLRGQTANMNPETEKAIAKNPPKMAGPLIWGMQHANCPLHGMEYARDMKTSFLERCYSPLLQELPYKVAYEVTRALGFYGVEYMTGNDIHQLEQADFRRAE
jgi:hypothetical protein